MSAAVEPRLAQALPGTRRRRRLAAPIFGGLTLVAPATVMLVVSLLAPIGLFLLLSIDNSEIPAILPRTVAALRAWDGAGTPGEAAYVAADRDIRDAVRAETIGALARRLNFVAPGYRSLVNKTANMLDDAPPGDARAQLVGIDRRWGDPAIWSVLKQQSHRYTDFYYLSAVDLRRDAAGHIERVPERDRLFVGLFARTLGVSLTVTLLCLAIGYPAAHLIATAPARFVGPLLVLVLLPFWTPILVRTTAWIVLLQNQGLVNRLLRAAGVIAQPLPLFGNRFAVLLAMTQVLLPYMILPLYAAMKTVPPELMRAAGSLGANPWRSFRRVYLPQTKAGIVAGSLIVFILALGYYVTPLLVGGPGDQMVSYFIAAYTNESLNWGLAAALGTLLLVLAGGVYAAVNRLGSASLSPP